MILLTSAVRTVNVQEAAYVQIHKVPAAPVWSREKVIKSSSIYSTK